MGSSVTSIKTIIRKSMPRLYSRLARERDYIRLLVRVRNGHLDLNSLSGLLDLIRDGDNFYLIGDTMALVLRDMPLSGTLLHFAPENCVAALLKTQTIQYVSADLNAPNVDLNLNIEKINLPDEQYDTIICSHVLEHVNDTAALLELHRILKPDGVLIAMVPAVEGCHATYEDETITSPDEREIHFGQYDHVRVYGADFIQRLTNAGFDVQAHTAFGKEAVRYGLLMGDKVFICRKTAK
jgi:SAM-dependent methyltransferase